MLDSCDGQEVARDRASAGMLVAPVTYCHKGTLWSDNAGGEPHYRFLYWPSAYGSLYNGLMSVSK